MTWQQIVGLLLAIMAADAQLRAIPAGETAEVDIPDVAFKLGRTRFDILSMTVKRAE